MAQYMNNKTHERLMFESENINIFIFYCGFCLLLTVIGVDSIIEEYEANSGYTLGYFNIQHQSCALACPLWKYSL